MVETKKFNPQLIRKKIEGFFDSSGIPVNHFFSNNSCLVAEEKLVNYSTRETVHAFSVVPTHPFASEFGDYLKTKYSFSSKFKDLIISYEAFFNRNTMPFYSEAVFYLIDNDEKFSKSFLPSDHADLRYGISRMQKERYCWILCSAST